MAQIKKYLSLYFAFFKASLVADMEYRSNFVIRIGTDIIWYVAQIITFETLFNHTSQIGKWDREQTRVFLGVLFVVDAIYMIMFSDNLDRFTEKVRKGDLDLILVKPVSSQFILSLQRVSPVLFGNLLIGSGWLIWSLSNLHDFSWWRILWLLALVPSGIISFYAVRFMVASTALIFTKSDNLQYLWYQFYKLGMRPDGIYSPWLRYTLLTAIPVCLIASVPASSLLKPNNLPLYLFVVLWSASLLYASHKFWNYALKKYSSASS